VCCVIGEAQAAPPQAEVTVDVEIEVTATEEPPKTEEEGEKKEEEKPAEEGGELGSTRERENCMVEYFSSFCRRSTQGRLDEHYLTNSPQIS
jgi:hypothetical protein